MLVPTVQQLILDLPSQQYYVDMPRDGKGNIRPVIRGDITVAGMKYECDTALRMIPAEGRRSGRLSFSTVIHPGVDGQQQHAFERLVNEFSLRLQGATSLKTESRDGSYGVILVTDYPIDALTTDVIGAEVDYHAQVKADLAPELETFANRLGLLPRPPGKENEIENIVKQVVDTHLKTKRFFERRRPASYLPRTRGRR